MLGIRSEGLHLTEKQREEFNSLLERLNRSTNACNGILESEVIKMEEQLHQRNITVDDVEMFTLRLASLPLDQEQPTANIVQTDRCLLARFAVACGLIARSTSKMHIDLKNESIILQRTIKDTTSLIKTTLLANDIDPHKLPKFKGLENALNEETEAFLNLESADGFTGARADSNDLVLLFVVRNMAIIHDMSEMLLLFARDLSNIRTKPL